MIRWKITSFVRSFTKTISESFGENWRKGRNFSKFGQQALLNLLPPSRYALNLKELIKASKISWTSQLSNKILRSSFERKFDKTNFISFGKDTYEKPMFFRVKTDKADTRQGAKIYTKNSCLTVINLSACYHVNGDVLVLNSTLKITRTTVLSSVTYMCH